MSSQEVHEWLDHCSTSERIRALARICSSLTVYTRELFLRDRIAGKEQRLLDMLQGLNEIHHTLANQLAAYSTDENKAYPAHVLSQMLSEIAQKYRIENFLNSAIDFARSRTPSEG